MSGLGAPARTPTPAPARATSVRVAAETFPALMKSSSMPACAITTSKPAPASTSCLIIAPPTKRSASWCPLARSNCGFIASSSGRMPPALMTLTSAAPTTKPCSARMSATILAMVPPSGVEPITLRLATFEGELYPEPDEDRAARAVDPAEHGGAGAQPAGQGAGEDAHRPLDDEGEQGERGAEREDRERRPLRRRRHELRQEGEVEDDDLRVRQVRERAVQEQPAQRTLGSCAE